MKDIKDYIHLYIGALAITVKDKPQIINGHLVDLLIGGYYPAKPLLRPLSSMTEEELRELYLISPYAKGHWLIRSVVFGEIIKGYQPNIITIKWDGHSGSSGYAAGHETMYLNKLDSDQHRYLLSKHFDLFGLIEAGLAIDATT